MNEFNKKTIEDLRKDLKDKRESLRLFRFGIAGSKLKNVKEGKNLKIGIARVLTELRSRSLKK